MKKLIVAIAMLVCVRPVFVEQASPDRRGSIVLAGHLGAAPARGRRARELADVLGHAR